MIRIGVDIDNCILDTCTPMLDAINKLYQSDYKLKDIEVYCIEESLKINRDVIDRVVEDAISLEKLPIIPGADKVLKWLQLVCYPLFFISDRPVRHYESTWKQLDNISLSESIIILTDGRRKDNGIPDKAYFINELKLDVFIEDRPDTILDLYESTECDILVFDNPWNRDIAENDRIYIMRNWIEIRDFFMRRIQGE